MAPTKSSDAFAVWVTGLPAAGKSTVARALKSALAAQGVQAVVLESDVLRAILTLNPTYEDEERDQFYRALAGLGAMLTRQGVPVIFDATAHRRAYREWARSSIPTFVEVYVDCSLRTCMKRDPKGIYRAGQTGRRGSVPGLHTPYEPPEKPDLVIVSDREEAIDPKSPERAAQRILDLLRSREILPPVRPQARSDLKAAQKKES